MNPKVDFYYEKVSKWQTQINYLRPLLLACNLQEELKWGVPCYTYQNANVVLVHTFKDYCALLFMKGALLKDTNGILVQQTSNVQAARQIRFTDTSQIVGKEAVLKSYIFEAIEIEKAGLKVELKKVADFPLSEEFQKELQLHPKLKTAFESLTPGRQKAYCLYFSAAKQAKTRAERVEKCKAKILAGKGLDD